MNVIIDNPDILNYYKQYFDKLKNTYDIFNIFQTKNNKLYSLGTQISTNKLLSFEFKIEHKIENVNPIDDIYISEKENYEKNTYVFSTNIYNKIGAGSLPSIEYIIYRINLITEKINITNLKKYKSKLRSIRHVLMKNILPYISNKKYFILPYVFPHLYISKNIAIVGNSKSILKKETGKEIDFHTNIMRFNYAMVDNDKKYCGEKSDIRISIRKCITGDKYKAHPEGLINNYNLYRNLKEKHYIVFTKDKNLTFNDIINDCKNNKINTSSKTYHCVHWTLDAHQEILLSHCVKTKFSNFLQCGLGFLLFVIDLGIIPDIYGFDLKECSDNYGYYWNKDIIHTKLSKFHDISIEHIILKQLIKDKKINYI